MFFGDADAKTSTGAPLVICSASAELAPNESLIVVPGWADSNCLASVVKAPVNDDAASTVTDPEMALADVEGDDTGDEFAVEESQAALTLAAATAAKTAVVRVKRTPSSSGGKSAVGHFDNDVGGLDGGDGKYSGLEAQLIRRFTTHQRHDAKRAGLDVYLGHDGVAYDPGDQSAHAVSGGLSGDRLRTLDFAAGGQLFSEMCQDGPLDREPATFRDGRDAARVSPPANRVIANAEQLSRFADPEGRHGVGL
jgi:hypothetical protein